MSVRRARTSATRRSGRLGRLGLGGLVGPFGLVVLAVVLAGCGGSAATLGRAIPAVGGAPQEQRVVLPKVGQCRELDEKALQAVDDNTPPVSCTAPHNAITFYVGRLSGDPTRFPSSARQQCQDRSEKAVGLSTDDVALTVVGGAFYYPSSREYALGATYVRCDLVPQDDTSSAAPPLPAGSTVPLYTSLAAVPDSLRRCRTGHGRDLPCTEPHVWRASGAFQVVGGGRQRPSIDFVNRQARQHCPGTVTTKRYLWTGPSKASWQDDDRTVTCFSHTTG